MQHANGLLKNDVLAKYSVSDSKNIDKDVYLLADKYGLGDVLGRDIPEPNNMEELNEQILTLEVVIRSLRKHIQTQYQRLNRMRLPGGLTAILFIVVLNLFFASGSYAHEVEQNIINSETAIVSPGSLFMIHKLW